jgi:hypothetical protein
MPVRPHGLRHAATTDADAGKSVQDVQRFGRWATWKWWSATTTAAATAGDVAALVSNKRRHDRAATTGRRGQLPKKPTGSRGASGCWGFFRVLGGGKIWDGFFRKKPLPKKKK